MNGRAKGAWDLVSAVGFGKVQLRLSVVRALVIGLVFWAGLHWLGPHAAAPIATAAFMVGTMDTTGSPRRAQLWMAVCTACLTLVTAIAAGLHAHHGALIGLLVLLAFLAGIFGGVTPKATQVLCYGALLAATYSVAAPEHGLTVTLGILLAGLIQTVACALLLRTIRYQPEVLAIRRAIADASALCESSTESERGQIMAQSIQSLYQAELHLAGTDLAQPDRDQLAGVVGELDELWLALRGDFLRAGAGVPWRSHDTEHTRLAALGAQLDELPMATRRVRQLTHNEFRQRLAQSIRPDSEAFAVGARLVLGVLAGLIAAVVFDLPWPAWVIAITLMSLRQDMGPTIPLALSRVLGTLVAVALIIPLAWLIGPHPWVYIPLVGMAAFLSFYLLSVNLIAVFAMFAATVVFIVAAIGQDPVTTVVDRLIDITLGSILALIIAHIFPLWTRHKVREKISDYARNLAQWAELAFRTTDSDQLTTAGQRVRAARSTVESSLAAAAHEPEAQHAPLAALQQIVDYLNAVNSRLVATHSATDIPPPASTTEAVAVVVDNLRTIGAELLASPSDGSPVPDITDHPLTSDRVDAAVSAAVDTSAIAVLATRELPALPGRRLR